MSKLIEMKDLELWEKFKAYYQTVKIHGSYRIKDLMYMNAIQQELESRGYKFEFFPSAWHPEKEKLEWN